MMRRMRGTGNVVAEERFIRGNLVDPVQVIDGVIRHAGDQIPAGLAIEGIELRRVAKEVWLPLVSVAADEPVEILEALPNGPIIKRPDLTGTEGRHVVVLAEPRRRITIVQQDAADSRLVISDNAVVAREARGLHRDHADAGSVTVASRNQRRGRRR